MNKKNRRKPDPSPFQNICLDQIPCIEIRPISYRDKQNQAKLALLDLGNDDLMFHTDVVLGEQNLNRNSLIERMKGYEAQERTKTAKRGATSMDDLNVLLPIDTNYLNGFNNFVEDKPTQTVNKKKGFSLRNLPFFKSKENLVSFRKNIIQSKKDEKTIVKLKKILKKLESPQRTKVNQQEVREQENAERVKKRKTSVNKIKQFCTQFLQRNISASKQRVGIEFGSHQKALQTPNEFQETVKLYQIRQGSKTSHQRRRSSFSRLPMSGTSTPTTTFFYKHSKLTNKNMLFKRNYFATGESMNQKNFCQGFKKPSARMNHQASRIKIEKNQMEDMQIQQEKIREDRKSRNLKNILFD